MLREILSQLDLDEDFLDRQGVTLLQDTVSFSREAAQLLHGQQALRDFLKIAELLAGEGVHLGAGTVLLLLKNAGKFDLWLGTILKSLDKEFCLASVDLLVREGEMNAGWKFSKKTRTMIGEEYPKLAGILALLGSRFGVGFTIGAYLQLELLRRREENDFGMELGARSAQ
jgi:hypothetical protein